MDSIQRAQSCLKELVKTTIGMKNGEPPKPMVVIGIHAELVEVFWQLGQEMNTQFSAKEQAYLRRKNNQARSHLKYRDQNLTVKDSETHAFIDSWEDLDEEVKKAAAYENYRTLLRAVDKGIEHARSVVSFLKTTEQQ